MSDFCPTSSPQKDSCFLMSINTCTTLNLLARLVLTGTSTLDNRETIDQEFSLLNPERTQQGFRRPQNLMSKSSAMILLSHQHLSNLHPTSPGPFQSSPSPCPTTRLLQNWPEQRKQPLTLAAPILCLPVLKHQKDFQQFSNRLAHLLASSCCLLHVPRGLYSC